jgi:hypothetical protein
MYAVHGLGAVRRHRRRSRGGVVDLRPQAPQAAPLAPLPPISVVRAGLPIGQFHTASEAVTLAKSASADGTEVQIVVGGQAIAAYKNGKNAFSVFAGAFGDSVTVNLPEGTVAAARRLLHDPDVQRFIGRARSQLRSLLTAQGPAGLGQSETDETVKRFTRDLWQRLRRPGSIAELDGALFPSGIIPPDGFGRYLRRY